MGVRGFVPEQAGVTEKGQQGAGQIREKAVFVKRLTFAGRSNTEVGGGDLVRSYCPTPSVVSVRLRDPIILIKENIILGSGSLVGGLADSLSELRQIR